MDGQRAVVSACLEAARRGRPGVLVTVVRVEGSAYRRPGARMFLPRDGEPVGLVSGGCLESDLAERAAAVLAENRPRTVLYDMRSPDDVVWGLGLGCDGAVRVLLEPIGHGAPPQDLAFLETCRATRREGVVVTVFETAGAPGPVTGERMLVDGTGAVVWPLADEVAAEALARAARDALAARRSRVARVEGAAGPVEALVEHVAPPIRLVVCGAGLDAVPVVDRAAALGWQVVVLDHRPGFVARRRFPAADVLTLVEWGRLSEEELPLDRRTAVVSMTHHFLHDLDILQHLAGREPIYVGLLGPRRRAERLLTQLVARGVEPSEAWRSRIHGPVGLDVGAETPEEIALSLLAEVQATFCGRRGGALRERAGPLHDWASSDPAPTSDR